MGDVDTSGLVKINFSLNPDDWHGAPGEKMWAKPIAGLGEVIAASLENTPFYVRGVSWHDVVRARFRDGAYEFSGVVSHSGHSTYRLLIDNPDDPAFLVWWNKLQDLGCNYENGGDHHGKTLFAVDVPPATDISAMYRILEEGDKALVWDFEEGHVGHPLNNAT